MSALAKICLNKGKFVSGSDKTKSHITDEIEHLGAKVFYKHQKKNIFGADLVVYTCAVGKDNIEVLEAQKNNIPVIERAEFLGEIAKEYDDVIAVAGSHGKTTTCGILHEIFKQANKNPTMMVGGETTTGNLVLGEKEILIVEACEYMEHFLKIPHSVSVILNIDFDHPDYFKTQKNYEKSFQKFVSISKKKVFVNEKYSMLIGGEKITFGCGGDYQAKHIKYQENYITFDVYKKNRFFDTYKLNCVGLYNVLNALAAIAVADYYNIQKTHIKKGVQEFINLKRRYEYMGKINNNIVITDYAHHPTQIKNCIKATKEVYNRKITVIFEPHTYTRTKALMSEFVDSLYLADNIIILPTYSAREKPKKGGTSRDLYNTISFVSKNVSFVKSYKKCKKELENLNNNIILILGAGSVIKLAEEIKSDYLNKNWLKKWLLCLQSFFV